MSIVQDTSVAASLGAVKWLGYGLAIAMPLAPELVRGPIAAVALLSPAIVLGLALAWAELFEIDYRRTNSRGINLVLVLVLLPLIVALPNSAMVDPELALLFAAVGAGVTVVMAIWTPRRTVLAGPGTFLLFMGLFGAGYGFAAPSFLDTRLDTAPGRVFQAQVVDRRESFSGRSGTSYYLRLAPWGPVSGTNSVRVSNATYWALPLGAQACVTLRPGAVGLAWYRVGTCGGA